MTVNATKVNGKGKRPDQVTLTFEGRQAYGTTHISIIAHSDKSEYALLNIDVKDWDDLLKGLGEAYKGALKASDTTPERYKVASLSPEILAALKALGINPADLAPKAPVVEIAKPKTRTTKTEKVGVDDDLKTSIASALQKLLHK